MATVSDAAQPSELDDLTLRVLALIEETTLAEQRRQALHAYARQAREDPDVAEIIRLVLASRRTRRRSVGAGRRAAMCVHGPGYEDEEYDYDDYYEPGMGQEQDGTGLTIRPVYGYESADYLDHLFSGRCPPEAPPQPRKPASSIESPLVPAEPAEPVSLRDKLRGWFPDR